MVYADAGDLENSSAKHLQKIENIPGSFQYGYR
jgi:hypothetical protein